MQDHRLSRRWSFNFQKGTCWQIYMKVKSRGEAEAEISQAVIKFEKDLLGRGPLDARTFFVADMILVRLRGILTPGDQKLAESTEGQALLKESRRRIFEVSRPFFEELVMNVTGCQLLSFHTDMSTKTGERILVLTVNENLERIF